MVKNVIVIYRIYELLKHIFSHSKKSIRFAGSTQVLLRLPYTLQNNLYIIKLQIVSTTNMPK